MVARREQEEPTMISTLLAGMGHGDGDGHMGDGWWWLMGVAWLVLLAAVVAIAIALTRRRDTSTGSRGSAQDTLDDRFARGEIDEDEYRKRRDVLRG